MKFVAQVIVACLCARYASSAFLNLKENAVCKTQDSVKWRCQKYGRCNTAKAVTSKGGKLDICGIKGGAAVVCCPPEEKKFPPGVLSKSMCQFYSKHVCEELPNVSFDPSAPPLYKDSCKTTTPLIKGGIDAAPGEFPHMAQIGFTQDDNVWSCGGSLISERFVLSAAHCKSSKNRNATRVRLGDYNKSAGFEVGSAEAIYNIAEIIPYPEHDSNNMNGYHDIMLLRLDRDVQFNAYVRPLCLHHNDEMPTVNITATGWGLLDTTGPQAGNLQKVNIDLISQEECQPHYRKSADKTIILNETTTFCAGDVKNSKDTCVGDSGGPLQTQLHEPHCMFNQVGIISKGGTFCGDVPAIYTRVSYYIPWIESIVWKDITSLPPIEPLKC